jgi:SAM-dependent methyltransferase
MNKDMEHDLAHRGEHEAHRRFDDPEMFAGMFDAPERDEWQKPVQVVESLNLSEDMTVAEIGAGTGYFALRLAKHLDNGKVIALDAEQKMVEYLKKRAAEAVLVNVDARPAELDGKINLQEKVDLILCVDAYHHIRDRVSYFSNFTHNLNNEGKLVIIDRAAGAPVGPPAELRIPLETVKKEMQQAGFKTTQELDFLLPYQFYLAFELAILVRGRNR